MYSYVPGTASSNVRLIGSLGLPHPDYCGFDKPRVEQILAVLPHLQEIDDRDLHGKFLGVRQRGSAF